MDSKNGTILSGLSIPNIINCVYNRTIRPHLPRKIGMYNGIPVRGPRLLDIHDVLPEYEGPLLTGLRKMVTQGDDVVVIGGGYGVSTIASARCAGSEANIICYEGGKKQVELINKNVEINRLSERIDVRHAVVETNIGVYSEERGATHIAGTDLPDADVLVMDCEGAELDILSALTRWPRAIVVETHGHMGSPTTEVNKTLESAGYEVETVGAENADNDVYVLQAMQ